MHFKVTGPVAAQMQAAFLDNWIKTTGSVLHGDGLLSRTRAERRSQHMQMFISSPEGGSDSMRLMYLTAITAAERTIDIEAAYFIPDRLMIRELVGAASAACVFACSLPGITSIRNRCASPPSASGALLLESGVEIYRVPTHHASLQDVDLRSLHGVGGLDQFRHALLRAERRGQPERLRRGFRAADDRGVRAGSRFSTRYTLAHWKRRSWGEKFAEIVVNPIRSQL